MANEGRNWSLPAEGIAIVVSILLASSIDAFSFDAWWDTNEDREAEQSAIKRLILEFEKNLSELGENKEIHRQALEATEQQLTMTGPAP